MIDALVFDQPVLIQLEQVEQVRKRRNRGVRSYAPVYAVGMVLLLVGGGEGQPPAYCEVVSVDPLLCVPVQQ